MKQKIKHAMNEQITVHNLVLNFRFIKSKVIHFIYLVHVNLTFQVAVEF